MKSLLSAVLHRDQFGSHNCQDGVASRIGPSHTITAVQQQINQAVATPPNLNVQYKNAVARGSSKINLLLILGVRGAPNLDAIPIRRFSHHHSANPTPWAGLKRKPHHLFFSGSGSAGFGRVNSAKAESAAASAAVTRSAF